MKLPKLKSKPQSESGLDLRKSSNKSKEKSDVKRRRLQLVQDGLVIGVTAALLVFTALARGINLLMALGAFFVGFLAVDFFWGKRVLRNLRVKRNMPEHAYVGEPFFVEIEVDATQRSSSAWAIVVEDSWESEDSVYDAPEALKTSEAIKEASAEAKGKKNAKSKKKNKKPAIDAKSKKKAAKKAMRTDAALRDGVETLKPVVYFPNVPCRETRKEYYVGIFTRRGLRRVKTLTASTRFPCGFFRSSERFDAPDQVLVFPRIGRLTGTWDSFAGKIAHEASVSTSLTSRIPDETVAVRDWRKGDSRRTIAWRATAKRNRLQARDFTKRQTRTILLILDLYVSPTQTKSKEDDSKNWLNVEKAISFAATLVKRYTEAGDSQLIFALNADLPENAFESDKRRKSSARNDAPNVWDAVDGGGSTQRAFTRLALATPPKVDRLHETLHAATAFNLRDTQVFVVSVEPLSHNRFDDEHLQDAQYVDVSSPVFDSYFQMNQASEEYPAL